MSEPTTIEAAARDADRALINAVIALDDKVSAGVGCIDADDWAHVHQLVAELVTARAAEVSELFESVRSSADELIEVSDELTTELVTVAGDKFDRACALLQAGALTAGALALWRKL